MLCVNILFTFNYNTLIIEKISRYYLCLTADLKCSVQGANERLCLMSTWNSFSVHRRKNDKIREFIAFPRRWTEKYILYRLDTAQALHIEYSAKPVIFAPLVWISPGMKSYVNAPKKAETAEANLTFLWWPSTIIQADISVNNQK